MVWLALVTSGEVGPAPGTSGQVPQQRGIDVTEDCVAGDDVTAGLSLMLGIYAPTGGELRRPQNPGETTNAFTFWAVGMGCGELVGASVCQTMTLP